MACCAMSTIRRASNKNTSLKRLGQSVMCECVVSLEHCMTRTRRSHK